MLNAAHRQRLTAGRGPDRALIAADYA